MWKEVVEYIDKVCSEKNKIELMSIYLTYIASLNPLKRVSQCRQYIIAMDIIKINDIKSKYSANKALEKIYNEKYGSNQISEKINNIKTFESGMTGINTLIESESKNIEMAFILKNVENYHLSELIKNIVTILIGILSIVFTYKASTIVISGYNATAIHFI